MNTKPKIRSMPGKKLELSQEDLVEVRIRQQTVAMAKSNFLLCQQGFNVWLAQLMDRYGIEGSNFMVNTTDGTITENVDMPSATATATPTAQTNGKA